MIGFIHIGKTGGSALKAAIKENRPNGFRVFGLQARLGKIIKENKDIKVIYGVRDPVSRFISSFNSRLRQGLPRYNVPWNDAEQMAFDLFKEPNDLAEALSSEDKKERYLARFSMLTINHVNKPLSYHLIGPHVLNMHKNNIAYAYSLETMEEDFEIIKKILKIPGDVKLPDDDIVAHKTPAHMKKEVSEVGADNVRKWYEKDYKIIDWTNEMKIKIKESL